MTTNLDPTYAVHYSNKPSLYTRDDYFAHAYDSQLRALNVVSVDRYSSALDDYVEVRRVP